MMRRLLFLLLIIALPAHQVRACDCGEAVPVSEKTIQRYDFIFIGKVVAISGCADKKAKVKFTVQKLFRGKSYADTEVEFDCSTDCQMSFSPGETWIIYAKYIAYGQSKVDLCSYSRKQFSDETQDYNTATHGMTFADETSWLEKTLGVQTLNEKNIADEQHHKNILPKGYEAMWYLAFGLAALIAIYFLSRKFLR